MDPLGHLAPWLFKSTVEGENGKWAYKQQHPEVTLIFIVDIRPTIGELRLEN